MARNIVGWREKNGPFRRGQYCWMCPGWDRTPLSNAPVLRIPEPQTLGQYRCSSSRTTGGTAEPNDGDFALSRAGGSREQQHPHDLAAKLGLGPLTLADILDALSKPAVTRGTICLSRRCAAMFWICDLKPGMVLHGVVRNVADFGAFVDIGVHQDGLVHISKWPIILSKTLMGLSTPATGQSTCPAG